MPDTKRAIEIREIHGVAELRQIQSLEKEVWNLDDIDVLPLTWAVASVEAGAIWLAAFDDTKLAGFAFAFPGISNRSVIFHSHQLAVRSEYRDLDVGYKLKLAQRERVLKVRWGDSQIGQSILPDRVYLSSHPPGQSRVSEITWTFDPLQSKNAHLNFFKLGVISDSYKVDLYGPGTSSVLHQNGTDRLWVRWPITSRRVAERIGEKDGKRAEPNLRHEIMDALSLVQPLILFSGDGRPIRGGLETALGRKRVVIEIPSDINSIEQKNPELAKEWRMATQWAFTESLKAGFQVAEFCRTIRGHQGPGAYLLEQRQQSE